MKNFKKIIAAICIFTMILVNITAFAGDGYTVKYNNDNTEVTVSISQTINEEVDVLNNTVLGLKTASLPTKTSTGTTTVNFSSWSKGLVAATESASIGQIGYYALASAKSFQEVLQGNIEDYALVFTFKKGCTAGYIDNFEIGLGNAAGTSGYANLPTVVKTRPLGNFGYTSAANGSEWTMTIKVSDILQSGNETRFPASGTPNALTADNINLFVFKAKQRITPVKGSQMVKFSDIKLVSQEGDNPLPETYSLINAFYDTDENLVFCDVANNAPVSLTSPVPGAATCLRSFVWEDLDETIKPLRPKLEVQIPIKRSILFIGGRGAMDSSKELAALAKAEGFDFAVDCIYRKNREIRDHWRNACSNDYDYELMRNGEILGGATHRIGDILTSKNYDIVIIEQSSGYAGVEDTFFPYIDYLTEYINEKCPTASIYYNTLWSYPSNYTGAIFQFYDNSPEVMKNMINNVAEYVESETDIKIINTNNIVYSLANKDALSLYQQEADTTFYRLNSTGKAAVQAQILYSISGTMPKAGSITSVYSGVTSGNADKILSYLN